MIKYVHNTATEPLDWNQSIRYAIQNTSRTC